MRNALTVLVLAAAVTTGGCSIFKSRAATPDEFAVARNAPLIIPPDFTLAPPVAGTAGRGSAQLGIRSQVWDPSTRLVDKGPTTVQILTAQNSSTNVASAQPGQ